MTRPDALGDHETVIRPNRGWLLLDWRQLWEARDLLMLVVRREITVKYRQTILGPLWFVLQPLAMTAVFAFVFAKVARLSTDGLPPVLFYLCGLLGWTYLSQNLTAASNIFTTNAHLFSKVYFPRLVMPMAIVIANSVAFALQFGIILLLMIFYHLRPGPNLPLLSLNILALPLAALQIAALSLGVSLWISCMTAKYRDLVHAMPFLIQIWMFVTPVIYPLSAVPERYQALLAGLNPMAPLVETVRWSILGTGSVDPASAGTALVAIAAILVSGVLLFQRVERNVVDTV